MKPDTLTNYEHRESDLVGVGPPDESDHNFVRAGRAREMPQPSRWAGHAYLRLPVWSLIRNLAACAPASNRGFSPATLALQTEGAVSGPLAPQRPFGRKLLPAGVDRSPHGNRISLALLVVPRG